MNKILVTGSAGLVGSQVVKDLVEKKFDVYSCYNADRPKDGLPTKLDLSREENIVETLHEIKPDAIIHLAAMTDVDLCEVQKELATLINTTTTGILARESAKMKTFFVYLSTDYVFDGRSGLKNEGDVPNPINVYGRTKLDGETAAKNFSTPCAIIRTSTPFGAHEKKKSFPLWIKENLELEKEIPVLCDQYTSPTFVPDLSKMLIEVTMKKIAGIIHLAGATRISRFEFAKMIAEKLNLDGTLLKAAKIEDMNWIAKRPQDSSLDVTKAKKDLENKPQEIEHSLELFINQIK